MTEKERLAAIRALLLESPEISPDKNIVITAEDRQRIERALGKNISSSKELADLVVHAMETTIEDVAIKLSPNLIDRLKTRCLGMPFNEFLPWLIKRELEEYAGLR